jgi:hypothetical protein
VGGAYLVVDTGPWIIGKNVMLPAGTIKSVDLDEKKVFVDRTKDDIKDAPEFDSDRYEERHLQREAGQLLRGLLAECAPH